jgi:hypothetical protein
MSTQEKEKQEINPKSKHTHSHLGASLCLAV